MKDGYKIPVWDLRNPMYSASDNIMYLVNRYIDLYKACDDQDSAEAMHFYELRGASENFTKELKNDFNGARVSHKEFWENEMDFLISAYAYNLFHLFQNQILKDSDQSITMNTFRLLFQKIAVKVIRHAGKISLRFSTAYTRQRRFMYYWNLVLQL